MRLFLPMLAVSAEPFESPEYTLGVIIYGGIRALAAVDTAGWPLRGRQQADCTARYPELDVLRAPAGRDAGGRRVGGVGRGLSARFAAPCCAGTA
jgi:hypothetical protein